MRASRICAGGTLTAENVTVVGRAFEKAALRSKADIDEIPLDVDVWTECDLIDAACAGATALAEQIIASNSDSPIGRHYRARAQAWLDGKYWAAYGKEI